MFDKILNEKEPFSAFGELYLLENDRILSFKDWPFPATSACSIAKMAEAGFYWTGSTDEIDTATCFVCGKTLDGWESNDDPWKEHVKRAPQCEFVKLGCSETEMTVEHYLKLFGCVVKGKLEKSIKDFKTRLTTENESKVMEYINKQA